MFTFRTMAEWKPGDAGLALTSDGKPTLAISAPPELGGPPGNWSPEDLLAGAVESCLLLTTLYFVKRLNIALTHYRSEAVGNLQKTPNGLRFTGVTVTITASVATAEDEPKMQQAVEQAKKFCPVSAAIAAPITVTLVTKVG